jgi:hypothetical protein
VSTLSAVITLDGISLWTVTRLVVALPALVATTIHNLPELDVLLLGHDGGAEHSTGGGCLVIETAGVWRCLSVTKSNAVISKAHVAIKSHQSCNELVEGGLGLIGSGKGFEHIIREATEEALSKINCRIASPIHELFELGDVIVNQAFALA